MSHFTQGLMGTSNLLSSKWQNGRLDLVGKVRGGQEKVCIEGTVQILSMESGNRMDYILCDSVSVIFPH